MLTVNVVYPNLLPAEGYALQRGQARVVWTRFPIEAADLYAYNSAYSYCGKRSAPAVLFQREPVVTQPREFTTEVWGHFDHVLTILEALDGILPEMQRIPVPVYGRDYGSIATPDYEDLRDLYPISGREHAICMINGHKTSSAPGELYSVREEIARWFHAHSELTFDVFGHPAFPDLPNYIRPLEHREKLPTLARYRYSLCLENCYDPFWSLGYITEKLPQCLESRTVPIYMGCSNIDAYVPPGCYIDYRELGSPAALNDYISGISEQDYLAYIDAIDDWLRAGNLGVYSVEHNVLGGLAARYANVGIEDVFGEEKNWGPSAMPPEANRRPGVGAPMTIADSIHPYWTWEYLAEGELRDCHASLDAVAQAQSLRGHTSRRRAPSGPKRVNEIRKALYVGVESTHGDHPADRQYSRRNIFPALHAWPGLDIHHVDPAEEVLSWGIAGMSQRLCRRVSEEGYDLVFYVPYARTFDVLPDAMRDITSLPNTGAVVWLSEPPDLFEQYSRQWADCADYVVTTSPHEEAAFAAVGHTDNVVRSRWAFRPSAYPSGERSHRREVTLVGARTDLRARVFDHLRAHGIPVTAHGVGWGKGRYLRFPSLLRTMQESAISLSVGSRRRVYEVTGAGGFLLTTPVEGLDESYVTDAASPDQAEVSVAYDVDQLVKKARYYLDHADQREAVAARGHRRALAEHTWPDRLAAVFAEIGWTLPMPGD